ncbi:hypothetical protein VIBNISOn1_400008 [Vibrio nigripulchritudo SOn1]|uniref:Uncharacterized protein n=2 Tax=Vibrio nigripulchritudo TaxID=28173 RepID=A0AAV2VTD2_9VIBR|nr:hypothetical protein VIBNISOn1_400008 [Vibrio nigripulchritudo SOn1]
MCLRYCAAHTLEKRKFPMKNLRIYISISLLSFSCFTQGSSLKIDDLIQKDNYALPLWEQRGLVPSPEHVIKRLERVTVNFLENLKKINENSELDAPSKLEKVQSLVDELPWDSFDTEEKEFLADVIAPAIESMGYNPWSII